MARIARLDDIDPINVAGVNWRPLRRTLGITAFGINAYTAGPGEQLIEPHDEAGGGGAGGHEEVYIVIGGHATFTVGGEEIDAPAGTIVFLDEPSQRREAKATAEGATALAIGGSPGTIKPSAWEHYFAAAPAVEAGDYDRAYEIAAAGLADHADNGSMHFNLGCFKALGGHAEEAIEHVRRAIELEPKATEWAREDSDLDGIRDHPDFPVAR